MKVYDPVLAQFWRQPQSVSDSRRLERVKNNSNQWYKATDPVFTGSIFVCGPLHHHEKQCTDGLFKMEENGLSNLYLYSDRLLHDMTYTCVARVFLFGRSRLPTLPLNTAGVLHVK